jgi:O-acetyl-ADP-ribose deacetylase (regulator of RNase III)/RimJ/RimL family protein N-acetyltransferase
VHYRAAAGLTVRLARPDDEAVLSRIDRATWSELTSPAPLPGGERAFFSEDGPRPEDVLVAERGDRVVGWAKIEHPTPFPASEHVWHVTGLAVDPAEQGSGVGRALVEALIEAARIRGARRLTLRVFAPNEPARRLYERLGFETEGVLRGEFRVGDDYVDDVLMALDLGHTDRVAQLEVLQTDITKLEVDAIANAANTLLAHGGGVAGAISRAGGPAIQAESDAKAPIGLGEAVETTAGSMPSRWVIHAATMEMDFRTDADIIERATRSTLAKADELGARSLALVAFGTGVGGFPLDEAARIMVGAVRAHVGAGGSGLERVVFAVHGDEAERAFSEALAN